MRCYANGNQKIWKSDREDNHAPKQYRTKLPVRKDVKAACWYGEKKGHMKKAIEKLRRVYPRLTIRDFEGYGHWDIMNHPEQLTSELVRFMNQ